MLHVQDEEAFSLQDGENQESAADSIENDSPCESTAQTSDTVRSTKRPLNSQVTKPATKRQRQIAKEDELLKKAITCMENVSNTNKANPRDADAVFGEYVASELRSIKNEHMLHQLVA